MALIHWSVPVSHVSESAHALLRTCSFRYIIQPSFIIPTCAFPSNNTSKCLPGLFLFNDSFQWCSVKTAFLLLALNLLNLLHILLILKQETWFNRYENNVIIIMSLLRETLFVYVFPVITWFPMEDCVEEPQSIVPLPLKAWSNKHSREFSE